MWHMQLHAAPLPRCFTCREVGGSSRVGRDDVVRMLSTVGDFHSKAGGSAANTTRGVPPLPLPRSFSIFPG